MTRKDYILIAEVFRVEYKRAETFATKVSLQAHIMSLAVELTDALKRDNIQFDREHFLAVIRGEKGLTSRP